MSDIRADKGAPCDEAIAYLRRKMQDFDAWDIERCVVEDVRAKHLVALIDEIERRSKPMTDQPEQITAARRVEAYVGPVPVEQRFEWACRYIEALERNLSPLAIDEAVWRANNAGPTGGKPSDV